MLRGIREAPKELVCNFRRKMEELSRQRMSQDLGILEASREGMAEGELPFPWAHSFRLLGVILDCSWHFSEHFRELRKKAAKRLQIVRRARGTVWGMESRIIAVTTHALI